MAHAGCGRRRDLLVSRPPTDGEGGATLDELIDRVPGWGGQARTVTPLDGGITNRNIRVDVDGGSYVVRDPGEGTAELGIDRGHEREAAERAAALGVGPEVVAFVEPEGSLVTRFVEGGPATGLGHAPQLGEAASLLRRFHDSGPITPIFDWHQVPQDYEATARAHGVAVPAAYDKAMAIADRVRTAFAVGAESVCPCHNDLLPANFLALPGGGLCLLDWEYAGMNDRYFDLGNFAVNNDLDADGEAALVAAYFGSVTARRLARLRLMKVISDLREAMWGIVQAGVSSLDVDFVDYAEEHFERLLVNASHVGFERLLADAAAPDA
jgi:thiamine kinase-like enzyme